MMALKKTWQQDKAALFIEHRDNWAELNICTLFKKTVSQFLQAGYDKGETEATSNS
jgi:hypothetical protein